MIKGIWSRYTFEVVWLAASEFAAAHQLLLTQRVSSGHNIPDCLNGFHTAFTRAACLSTFNLKHFQVVSGLVVQQSYLRL